MWPAVGSLMCRPAAISGSRPIATNSLVPMPKPPSASARTASFSAAGCGATIASRLRSGGTNCCGGQEGLLSVIVRLGTCSAAEHPIHSKASGTSAALPHNFCLFRVKVMIVTALAERMLSLFQCKDAGHQGLVEKAPATAGEVFALIRDGIVTTRTEVRAVTGLSRTAVSARVSALTARGLVTEGQDGASTGGRPPTLLRFDADAGVVLAVAIGRSRTQLAIANLAGEIRAHTDVDSTAASGLTTSCPIWSSASKCCWPSPGHQPSAVLGVGVSMPGTVDRARGCSLDSPMMSGWDGIALAPYFRETDRRTGGGRQRRQRHGTGPTARRIPRCRRPAAAEAVHRSRGGHHRRRRRCSAARSVPPASSVTTKSLPPQGLPCRCGDTGCLEAIAGGLDAGARAAAAGPHRRPHP